MCWIPVNQVNQDHLQCISVYFSFRGERCKAFEDHFYQFNNACKYHEISYYIMQYHAKWHFENLTTSILYSCSVINMSSHSQTISRAVLDDKLKNIQHSKYDNYMPFSYNGLSGASSLFVASHELWSLPMATNSNFFFFRKIFFILPDQAGQDGVDSKPIHFGNCLDWTGFQKVVPTTYMSCRIKISSNYPSELC